MQICCQVHTYGIVQLFVNVLNLYGFQCIISHLHSLHALATYSSDANYNPIVYLVRAVGAYVIPQICCNPWKPIVIGLLSVQYR